MMLFNKQSPDPDLEGQNSTQVLLSVTESTSKWNNEGESCQIYDSKHGLNVVEKTATVLFQNIKKWELSDLVKLVAIKYTIIKNLFTQIHLNYIFKYIYSINTTLTISKQNHVVHS